MSLPEPYYERDGIVIYNADCRDVLPELPESHGVIITDPVWPNALASLAGSDDPYGLLAAAAIHFPRLARRVVLHLGCLSDPRFLSALPDAMPFVRLCWLRFARPAYRGCQMSGADVAYVFGDPSSAGMPFHIFPGEATTASDPRDTRRRVGHPAPRKLQHVRWLVSTWSKAGELIIDPFLGSGTTAIAARILRRPCVGIEIDEAHCATAVRRLAQEVMALE